MHHVDSNVAEGVRGEAGEQVHGKKTSPKGGPRHLRVKFPVGLVLELIAKDGEDGNRGRDPARLHRPSQGGEAGIEIVLFGNPVAKDDESLPPTAESPSSRLCGK